MEQLNSSFPEDLQNQLRCPLCQGRLKFDFAVYQCIKCDKVYPVIGGIPDLYPSENMFAPRKTSLKDKYELFGENKTRPNSFQNVRRKQLTLEMISGNDVLEIGSAEGWMSKAITKKVKRLVSCDIAMSYLKRAKAQGIEAHFVRIDAHYLPFAERSFDCVLLTEVLEHVYSPYRVLEEIHRVLKPGGKLILSVPNNLTFSNIFQHLFHRRANSRDAHISFYDMLSIERLLNFVGFTIDYSAPVFIYIPLIKPLFYFHRVQNILRKPLKNFSDKLIIKAKKVETTLWEQI